MNKVILLNLSFFVFSCFFTASFNQVEACGCQTQQSLDIDETLSSQMTQTIIP